MPAVKRIIDLTADLYPNCPVCPGFTPPQITLIKNGPEDKWHMEHISMNLHQGTHIDAPLHLIEAGTPVDQIPVEDLQGPAVPVDLYRKKPKEAITVADLEQYAELITRGTIVLLCTGWGEKRAWTTEYTYESPWLSTAAAKWLVRRGVKGVGIDHWSVGGQAAENESTHRTLLTAGVWIAEALVLPKVLLERPTWHVFALPMKVRDASGAQARVVAVEYADGNGQRPRRARVR